MRKNRLLAKVWKLCGLHEPYTGKFGWIPRDRLVIYLPKSHEQANRYPLGATSICWRCATVAALVTLVARYRGAGWLVVAGCQDYRRRFVANRRMALCCGDRTFCVFFHAILHSVYRALFVHLDGQMTFPCLAVPDAC